MWHLDFLLVFKFSPCAPTILLCEQCTLSFGEGPLADGLDFPNLVPPSNWERELIPAAAPGS
jgi:hypothetical protein